MKIAFRRVPFSHAQAGRLNALAASADAQTIWFARDAAPTARELSDCDALMGYFPPALLGELPALRWVQTPSAGVEALCAALQNRPDVTLTNCSGAFGAAIAEYMLCGLLMLMRRMPGYLENQKAHRWASLGPCRTILGSTVTVVGMGGIGRAFAARAKALGAHVRGVRRSVPEGPDCFDEVYTADALCEAVRDVDAVVLCLPATVQTARLLSRDVIGAMDPRTIVVNCGRGSTVDEDALTCALKEKRIAGTVLDVAAREPLPESSPLWSMENVVLTPHVSGSDDDPINAAQIFAIFEENLKRYLAGEPLTHVVDRARGY